MTHSQDSSIDVYVCSDKGRPLDTAGIQLYRLALANGELTPSLFVSSPDTVGFLAAHPDGRHLYGVNWMPEIEGQPGGGANAYQIDQSSGGLLPLNLKPVHGVVPCYVSIDPSGRWLLTANYVSGNVTILPILEDGPLGDATDVIQHHGSSVNPQRQESPHTHSVIFDPTGRYALVADLGIDKIIIYRLEINLGRLKLLAETSLSTPPGAGPRHLAFHPNGRFLYCTNELDSTLTVFAGDVSQGSLREIQTLSSLPVAFKGYNSLAHLQFSISGEYLYVSNRGHDSITIFSVDAATGQLGLKSHILTQGSVPRHFAIDPTGRYLIVANEKSSNMATFRIDGSTGDLSLIAVTDIPSPIFVLCRYR